MSDVKLRGEVVDFGESGKAPIVVIQRASGQVALRFWNRDVQQVARGLKKGQSIEVTATAQSRSWSGPKGTKWYTDLEVDSVQVMGGGKEDGRQPGENADNDVPF